jgi:hypothetical protein
VVAAEPIAFALAGQPFLVRDLPGRLDIDGKVVLVRRLLKEGLFIKSAAPATSARSAAAGRRKGAALAAHGSAALGRPQPIAN